MRRVYPSITVFLALAILHPFQTVAQDTGESAARESGAWREPGHVSLELRSGRSETVANWAIDIGERGDFVLELRSASGERGRTGRILVVGGQAMAVEAMELEAGNEMDALDMPAFHFQLVYALLETLFPEGPAGVRAIHEVEHAEDDSSIAVGTASAVGEFAAPWYVKGTVSRRNQTNIDFDFVFTFTVDPDSALTFPLYLRGSWCGGQFAIEDDFAIDGWTVYTIGPYTVKTEDGVSETYGAHATGRSYRTVGELRAALETADSSDKAE